MRNYKSNDREKATNPHLPLSSLFSSSLVSSSFSLTLPCSLVLLRPHPLGHFSSSLYPPLSYSGRKLMKELPEYVHI